MDIKGRLEKKVSKAGKDYFVLIIKFPNGYERQVYLEPAEIYMLNGGK